MEPANSSLQTLPNVPGGRLERSVRAIRIALFVDIVPNKRGSMEAWLVGFAEEARRRGHRIDTYTEQPVHSDIRAALERAGVSWHRLGALRDHPVRAARRLARDYDVIHLNFIAARGSYGVIAGAAWPARVLMVDHNSITSDGELTRNPLRRLASRLSLLRIAGVAGVSQFVARRVRRQFGLGGRRLRTIYNGVDITRFAPPPSRAGRDRLVVIGIAYLIKAKGLHLLIEAVARAAIPRLELIIVGDGPERGALESLAQRLGVASHTTFLGLRNDVDQLLRDADIVVHPALWHEAFGFTVVEAMACGCAVIAAETGAIPELIEDGRTGLLVPPNDTDALVRALTRLAEDPDLRARLGEAAREKAVAAFSLSTCVRAHLDWCEQAAR